MTYPGSAGGQPRLTLPFTRLNPNDPKFAEKFEAIIRTLTTWANTLLLGGGGGMGLLSYGYYSALVAMGAGTINPVDFTATDDPSFAYVTSGLISFPTDSVNLIIVALDENFPAGTDPVSFDVILAGNSGAAQLQARSFIAGLTSSSNKAFNSLELSYIYNTTGPFAADAPLQVKLDFAGLTGNVEARLFILSWQVPT